MRNLWEETAEEKAGHPPLSGDASADLVIVGGGFTGCSAALHAAETGASGRLIEAETIGHGGSGRNVGLVNAGLWTPPREVRRILGDEAGDRLNATLAAAPDLVFSLIEQHRIACEPRRDGTLHCAHSRSGLAELRDRCGQLREQGAPVTLLPAEETAMRTGSSVFYGALHDARAGTIQPLAYARGLARAAAEAGAVIHERSPAVSIRREAGGWTVEAPGGRVRAGALLLATNAYHRQADGLPALQSVPVQLFLMATAPLGDNLRRTILPGGEGCWDTAKVMSWFRMDGAGRLILGGVGSLERASASIHKNWAQRKLRALFPHLGAQPLHHAWSGRIAMTGDHLPKILRLGARGLAVFGYSGRGIGPGTVFGKAAALALLSGDETGLPFAPVECHYESFREAKAAFYEIGASLAHLAPASGARKRGGQT